MEMFKKIVFVFFTICSLAFYGFGAMLYYTHLTDTASMALMFFMPSLLVGLVSGVLAFMSKIIAKIELSKFLTVLHRINLVLMLLGTLVYIYYYFLE